MTDTNAFALRDSGLNEFLFAEVGTETNGSRLTVLSLLARLGEDPWRAAARWTALPRAAASELLAQAIARMPLVPQELAAAPATAARLVLLLPGQAIYHASKITRGGRHIALGRVPRWVLLVALACLMTLAGGLNYALMSTPHKAPSVETTTSVVPSPTVATTP